MGHGPTRLFGSQRRPVPLDHAGTPFERTYRASPTGVTIEAALNANRTRGTVVRRLTPQHLIITLGVDLNVGHIEVKARQFPSYGFTLGCHKEAVQFLLD